MCIYCINGVQRARTNALYKRLCVEYTCTKDGVLSGEKIVLSVENIVLSVEMVVCCLYKRLYVLWCVEAREPRECTRSHGVCGKLPTTFKI